MNSVKTVGICKKIWIALVGAKECLNMMVSNTVMLKKHSMWVRVKWIKSIRFMWIRKITIVLYLLKYLSIWCFLLFFFGVLLFLCAAYGLYMDGKSVFAPPFLQEVFSDIPSPETYPPQVTQSKWQPSAWIPQKDPVRHVLFCRLSWWKIR